MGNPIYVWITSLLIFKHWNFVRESGDKWGSLEDVAHARFWLGMSNRSNEMFTPVVTEWGSRQAVFSLFSSVVGAAWQCLRTSFVLLPITKCAGLKVNLWEKWTPHKYLERDCRSALQYNKITINAMIEKSWFKPTKSTAWHPVDQGEGGGHSLIKQWLQPVVTGCGFN